MIKSIFTIIVSSLLMTGCSSKPDNNDNGSNEQVAEKDVKIKSQFVRIAQKARKVGNTDAAVKFYKKAIEDDASDNQALLGLAEVYVDMKLLDAALSYIQKAEENGCNVHQSHYLRGKVQLLSGSLDFAEKEFKESGTVDALNALGTIHDLRGDHKKAQETYKIVISKDPSYIDAYSNMGLSLLLCDKYKEAIFYLENACSLPEACSIYRGNLALAYGLSGDVSKAKQIYAQDLEEDEINDRITYIEDLLAAKKTSK